jgi:hypothetical protein
MDDGERHGAWGHFRRGLGESTRTNGLAYGYSIVTTAAFGLEHALDAPLAASLVYLAASALESTLARGVHAVAGTEDLGSHDEPST